MGKEGKVLAEERRAVLLQELQHNGYLEVTQVSTRLGVSSATIRRDLGHMDQEGQLVRTRGGAVPATRSTTLEIPYDIKRAHNTDEKRRIAAAAAEMVHDGETIALDAGSTTYQLALQLIHRHSLTVVTNDLHIAVKLAAHPNITLLCTGGMARSNVFALLGHQTEAFLKALRVNKTFLGADAIHPDGVIANVNLDEVPVKQAMLRAGEQVIVLADASKFDVSGFAKVCNLAEIHALITDSRISKRTLSLLTEWQVDFRIV